MIIIIIQSFKDCLRCLLSVVCDVKTVSRRCGLITWVSFGVKLKLCCSCDIKIISMLLALSIMVFGVRCPSVYIGIRQYQYDMSASVTIILVSTLSCMQT